MGTFRQSDQGAGIGQDIAFRLSLWYGVILIGLFTLAFLVFFPLVGRNLERRTQRELDDKIDEFISIFKERGLKDLGQEFAREAHHMGVSNVLASVLDPAGKVLITSDTSQWKRFGIQWDLMRLTTWPGEPVVATVRPPGFAHAVRVAYLRLTPDKILRVALLLRHDETFLHGLRRDLILTLALTLTAVLLVGWVMLQGVMGRVVAVTRTATSISSKSLDQRVPVGRRGDEIDRLAQAFNGMLDRIGSLVKGLQEVTDNVAHDLKMPLARIRLTAESLATAERGKGDVRELTGAILEDSDRLLEMVNTTHEIKAIEAGSAVWDWMRVDVADVVREAGELFELVAEDKKVMLHLAAAGPLAVRGDLRRLQRVFANLLDNAVKYTPAGGTVDVAARAVGSEAIVEIRDTGIGIDPRNRSRIFERFYRGDRSRSVPGLGLGLSLAESIVKAHGGRIDVESAAGKGSLFRVVLPLAQGKE